MTRTCHDTCKASDKLYGEELSLRAVNYQLGSLLPLSGIDWPWKLKVSRFPALPPPPALNFNMEDVTSATFTCATTEHRPRGGIRRQ